MLCSKCFRLLSSFLEYFFALLGQSYYFWHCLSSFINILNVMYTFWYFLMMLQSFQLFCVNSLILNTYFESDEFQNFFTLHSFSLFYNACFGKQRQFEVIMSEKWTSDLQLSAFSTCNSLNLLSSYNDARTKDATLPNDRYRYEYKTMTANFENCKDWIAESQNPK